MCSLGIEPTTFALLTQCSTTEPQEDLNTLKYTPVLNTLLNDIMFLLQFIVETVAVTNMH